MKCREFSLEIIEGYLFGNSVAGFYPRNPINIESKWSVLTNCEHKRWTKMFFVPCSLRSVVAINEYMLKVSHMSCQQLWKIVGEKKRQKLKW